MPVKLNIGLSRKIGEANYSSRGASVNIEMELDSSLVADTPKLQERIRQLFGLVRGSLAEELNGGHAPASTRPANGAAASPARPATQSQVRAIRAIAGRQRVDLGRLLQERFGIARPEELSLPDASQLIDQLKGTGNGEGGGA